MIERYTIIGEKRYTLTIENRFIGDGYKVYIKIFNEDENTPEGLIILEILTDTKFRDLFVKDQNAYYEVVKIIKDFIEKII